MDTWGRGRGAGKKGRIDQAINTHTYTRRGTEDGRGKGSYFDRAIRESCIEEVAIKVRLERSREESQVAIWGKQPTTSECKGPEAESA